MAQNEPDFAINSYVQRQMRARFSWILHIPAWFQGFSRTILRSFGAVLACILRAFSGGFCAVRPHF
jgi:hypothetical protein